MNEDVLRHFDDAMLATMTALQHSPGESSASADRAVVDASTVLCGILRSLSSSFWDQVQQQPSGADVRQTYSVVSDPQHVAKYIAPSVGRLLRRLGFRPPSGAEEFAHSAMAALAEALTNGAALPSSKIDEIRAAVESFALSLCRLSDEARALIEEGKPIPVATRKRERRLAARGLRIVTGLLICYSATADTIQIDSYLKQGDAAAQAINEELRRLSPVGLDSMRQIGLHEAERAAEE